MGEGETLLTDWRSLSWAGEGLQGDTISEWLVWWCMTSPSHHQPENLDRSLWVDPSREPLGKPSGETLGGNPRGILEDPSGSTPHHSSQRPQAQKWGIPTLLPTRGKGGKRGGKGGVTHTISSIFLWGRTPTPPLNWHEGADLRSAEKTKGGGRAFGARVGQNR